jgi:ribosomal protein S18 acetylase RimI-like enzyme
VSQGIIITAENGGDFFYFEKLKSTIAVTRFSCSIAEYNTYLCEDALRSQNDHIALTWLLCDSKNDEIAAYMSLIADAIKLSASEKELHVLDYPFKTIPAMKIAKLAVDSAYQEMYKGIGSFMIHNAALFAYQCNNDYLACRFLTVDADIEHNADVLQFYEKNGFLINTELANTKRKTISMRKDIYF